jgi:hypothetical protein
METKICTNCNIEKLADDFSWRNKNNGTKHSSCKECYKEIRKKNYANNKDYYLKKNKRIRDNNNEWYKEYKKGKSCVICNESESVCLDFHHINGEDKTHLVSKMRYNTYSKETMKKEIEKCIILCANCHRKVHENIIKIPTPL